MLTPSNGLSKSWLIVKQQRRRLGWAVAREVGDRPYYQCFNAGKATIN